MCPTDPLHTESKDHNCIDFQSFFCLAVKARSVIKECQVGNCAVLLIDEIASNPPVLQLRQDFKLIYPTGHAITHPSVWYSGL